MTREQIIKAVTGTFGLKLFILSVNFVTAAVLANILGAEGFGLYTLGVTWATLLVIIGKIGADLNAVRYCAIYYSSKMWNELKGFIIWQRRSVAKITIAISIFSAITACFVLECRDNSTSDKIYLLSILLIPTLSFMQVNLGILRGIGCVYKAQIGEFTKSMLLLLITLSLLPTNIHITPDLIVIILICSSLCALILGSFLINRQISQRLKITTPSYEINAWWKSSLTFTISSGVAIVNRHIDIVMVGAIMGAVEAGIYAVSKRVLSIVIPVQGSANFVLGPKVVTYYTDNKPHKIEQLGIKASVWITLVVSFICLFLIIGGKLFLSIFGEEFVAGYGVILILVIGQIIDAAFGPVGMILNMSGQERYTAMAAIYSCVINILLNIILIPEYGLVGAAISSVTSLVVWNLFLRFALRKELGINPSFLCFGIYK